ncbi:MAG: alpha/beta hydrolase fold domain-containing protein [Absicoccus sp.]|uniref:alpha/beta hydrolase n=1 Tax=Absicoccus TaxID=2718525 RepID=UPI002409DB5C|nr:MULTISPECIES: alpha/beta hydrolase fold domain-containing protein [Absicoccus]MDD6460697.1 alpha/beta hydrolase fold domain-containing protein [Absicoccus porci]MDY3035492.1 alpha/beta hydrolase fold domain-containing protein [Absicoccus sp.]
MLLILFNVGFTIFLPSYRQNCEAHRMIMQKTDKERIGERLIIPRKNEDPVSVNIYVPQGNEEEIPIVFHIHGGGFVAGDADALDTLSHRLCNQWHAMIVSVNYTTADVKPISYGVKEIADVVKYFDAHAETYHVDPKKMDMIGYSAGAYYAAETTKMLIQENEHLNGLILCYPWTTGLPKQNFERGWLKTMFVLAGRDPISQRAKSYMNVMKNEVDVDVQTYPDAQHSFIESNNPEGKKDSSKEASYVRNKKQKLFARQAEEAIGQWIKKNGI